MKTLRSRYVAEMPQLAYTGLSENWLLKTCGDLHWRQLATSAGLTEPAFQDAEGSPVYAAFIATRVCEAEPQAIFRSNVNVDETLELTSVRCTRMRGSTEQQHSELTLRRLGGVEVPAICTTSPEFCFLESIGTDSVSVRCGGFTDPQARRAWSWLRSCCIGSSGCSAR